MVQVLLREVRLDDDVNFDKVYRDSRLTFRLKRIWNPSVGLKSTPVSVSPASLMP